MMAAISSSLSIVVSPSEQSRKTSPGRALKERVSTSTSASGPRARVMIERCGWSWACSSEIRPWRRSSSTSEWSEVSIRRRPSRHR